MAGELAFSADELAEMASTQEGHMMDKGHIMRWITVDTNEFNVPVQKWMSQPATLCGFQFANKTDEVQDEADVEIIDAELRLPKGADITSADCFLLTHRFGSALEIVCGFEVIGVPRKGPSGLVADLALVTDGRFS